VAPIAKSRRDSDREAVDVRTPPHSLEAEQAVLGGLLLDASAWFNVSDVVRAEDFYRPDHRTIFDAIRALATNQKPTDAVTVAEHLERHGQSADVGGLAYLGTLARDTPTAANVRAYAEIVHERSMLRQLIKAGTEIAASAYNTEGETARELVDRAEQGVFAIAEAGARAGGGARSVAEMLPAVIDQIDEWHSNPDQMRGLATGFTDFDKLTGGLRAGDLVIIAGRPSMGKSTLAVNMAEYAAINPKIRAPVAIFSMEMPADQIITRMLASIGGVPLSSLRSGKIADEDWARITSATSQLSEAKIFIDETPALTPTDLRARARRLKREHGLGLVVIDYLQLMQVPGNKENRATEIAEISRGLKVLAKELAVPVIALSQLNRSVEQREHKKPVMSDLRECVTGDTLVCLTDGRRIPIRELVGQEPEVWSLDEHHRLIAARSDKVWSVGKKKVYQVQLASGRTMRATAEHRLLAGKGWSTLSQLQAGDRLALTRRIPEPQQCQRWPEHWLVLLGHLVGDGSYLKNQPLRYTSGSEWNLTVVAQAAAAFGSTVRRYAGRGLWQQLRISGNGNRWHAAGVGRWLKELGIFGQPSHEKRLPAGVFTLADDQIALLLSHLWATEGSISLRKPGQRGMDRVYFASSSLGLVMDVAALLLRLGIVGRIRTLHTEGYRPCHTIDVSGGEAQARFVSTVGGVGPRESRAEALAKALASRRRNPNVDTLPEQVLQRVVAIMGERGITRSDIATMRGFTNVNLDHSPSRMLIASYAEILKDDELTLASQSDLFWDRVVSISSDGEQEVFDLTVPGPANWLADGIVTHNSGAIEQDSDMILLIYRDEVYDKNTTKKGIAEIELVKHRNGEIGQFYLTFQGQFTRFANYAPDSYAEGILR
jgi:replicative DNA helicase